MPTPTFFAHWYFHLPNLILIVLTYALVARYVASFILPAGNVLVRVLNAATNPVVHSVGAITPRIAPPGLVILFAIAWLFTARIALLFGLALAGIRPRL